MCVCVRVGYMPARPSVYMGLVSRDIIRTALCSFLYPLAGYVSDPSDGDYVSGVLHDGEHIPLGQQLPGY